MRRARLTGQAAINQSVYDLLNKFEYPDVIPEIPAFIPGGGGSMAHVLIVSTSEPENIQAKADYVVPSQNSSQPLQDVFDAISGQDGAGSWSVWMAGSFELDSDVTTPNGAWIRGLGFYEQGGT